MASREIIARRQGGYEGLHHTNTAWVTVSGTKTSINNMNNNNYYTKGTHTIYFSSSLYIINQKPDT